MSRCIVRTAWIASSLLAVASCGDRPPELEGRWQGAYTAEDGAEVPVEVWVGSQVAGDPWPGEGWDVWSMMGQLTGQDEEGGIAAHCEAESCRYLPQVGPIPPGRKVRAGQVVMFISARQECQYDVGPGLAQAVMELEADPRDRDRWRGVGIFRPCSIGSTEEHQWLPVEMVRVDPDATHERLRE